MSPTHSVGAPADTPVGLPNCGVVSVAIICGWDHKTAWERLKTKQRGGGRGWRGRTYGYQREAVLKEAGVEYITKTYHRGRRDCPMMTLAQWLRSEDFHPELTYELVITGHAMVLHCGRVFDQDNRLGIPVHKYKRQRARVRAIRLITGGSPLITTQKGDDDE